MKTATEILKEIRRLAVVEGQKAYSGPGGYYSGQASGLRVSGDLLEAWLRGWDKEFEEAAASQGPDPIGPLYGAAISASRTWIRADLLGTTQQEKP